MSSSTDLKSLVPTFIIHADGSRIAAEKEADIKEITIIEKVDQPSLFIIAVSDMLKQWADSDEFAEGSKIKITLGYKDNVEELIDGEVTTLSLFFKKNGQNITTIKGQNYIHRFAKAKKTRAFTEMTDTDIIKQIADDAGLGSEIDDLNPEHVFTMQRNVTDYDYLMEMANKHNCKVWANNEKLFFKKMEDKSDEDVVLEWGKTLVEFTPTLDVTNLITDVEVRGWDNEKAEAVVGKAALDDVTLKIGGDNLGGKIVKENFNEQKMIYIDENIIDQDGADRLALNILTGNSMNYIEASGRCEGNTKIRAGMSIQLNELGGKFSGKYYVTTVKHVLSTSGGYATYFNLQRNAV